MAFPTTSVLDQPARADESPLANGTWSGPIISADAQLRLLSNLIVTVGSGVNAQSYWSAASFGPDTESWGTIAQTSEGQDYGCYARVANPNTGTTSGYAILYRPSTGIYRYRRIDNGVYTTLGSDITVPVALVDSDRIGLEVIGSTLTLYYFHSATWTALGTTASDSTYSASGRIGLLCGNSGGPGAAFSNFGGGTVAAGGEGPTVTWVGYIG